MIRAARAAASSRSPTWCRPARRTRAAKSSGRVGVQQHPLVPDRHVQSRMRLQQAFHAPIPVVVQNRRDEPGRDERRMPALAFETGIGNAPVIGPNQRSNRREAHQRNVHGQEEKGIEIGQRRHRRTDRRKHALLVSGIMDGRNAQSLNLYLNFLELDDRSRPRHHRSPQP
jgi:hypothetical protein